MDQSQALNDILESVQFLRDNAASKEDLKSFATKEDVEDAKNEILTLIDGFIVLHQKVDIEVVATKALYRRLDTNVTGMAKFVRYPLPA